jgi:hypothetical protein
MATISFDFRGRCVGENVTAEALASAITLFLQTWQDAGGDVHGNGVDLHLDPVDAEPEPAQTQEPTTPEPEPIVEPAPSEEPSS